MAEAIHRSVLFNHESPRRGETFVTRKIAMAAARIAAGKQEHLYLGNLDAVRDWGYAPEYVDAIWRLLQHDEPMDFVVATGTAYTVRDFVQFCFEHVGLDWEKYVRFDERHMRPTEVDSLIGEPAKATEILGWKSETPTPQLDNLMAEHEQRKVQAIQMGRTPAAIGTPSTCLCEWKPDGTTQPRGEVRST